MSRQSGCIRCGQHPRRVTTRRVQKHTEERAHGTPGKLIATGSVSSFCSFEVLTWSKRLI